MTTAATARIGTRGSDSRQQGALIDADLRLGRAIRSDGGCERLIGDLDPALEGIEHRIVVDRPPGLIARHLRGHGRLPPLILLVGVRDRRARATVVRPYRTGAQQPQHRQQRCTAG